MLHGLITICHEVGNDGYRGSYWPKAGVRYISISTHKDFPKAVVDFDVLVTDNSRPKPAGRGNYPISLVKVSFDPVDCPVFGEQIFISLRQYGRLEQFELFFKADVHNCCGI